MVFNWECPISSRLSHYSIYKVLKEILCFYSCDWSRNKNQSERNHFKFIINGLHHIDSIIILETHLHILLPIHHACLWLDQRFLDRFDCLHRLAISIVSKISLNVMINHYIPANQHLVLCYNSSGREKETSSYTMRYLYNVEWSLCSLV